MKLSFDLCSLYDSLITQNYLLLISILIGIATALAFPVVGTWVVDFFINAPTYNGPKTDHFDGKKFSNLDGIRARGFTDIIKWALTEEPGEWKELNEKDVSYGKPPIAKIEDGSIHVTFVNHATFLIQACGLNILTDPIWSLRASPFQWIGPKRMRPPGIRFEDLPDIDLVLISHNHYDHLDIHTVKRLQEEHNPQFITPLGVSLFLHQHGITNTVEMDWWESREADNAISISAVPSQHFSGRGLSDRDKTLWCGYVLQTKAGTVYFAGDSGYDGFFEKIGSTFNPIDLALIPIGAYRPRWFMEPIHVDPEQAVQIHRDVGARKSIGMHFGTFPLADDGMNEPQADLAKAKEKYGLAEDAFITLEQGGREVIKTRQEPKARRPAVG